MSPKRMYDIFKELFNWFVPHVVCYSTNRTDGGIDITLDSGENLNFNIDKNHNWILKRR